MGIYKRNGVWYANYFDEHGKRCRPSLYTKDKRIAEIKFAEIRQKTKTIKDISYTPNLTFDEFLLKFNSFISLERKERTTEHYHAAIRYLKKHINIRLLSDITPNALQQLKENLAKEGRGHAGINRVIRALKAMMRQAEKWELVPMQRWQDIAKFKEKKGRIDFYTEKELKQMLSLLPNWRLIILLGAQAGLRRAEMAQLKWQDIDFKNNQIYVAANKTDNYRYVPLTQELKETLKDTQKYSKNQFVIQELGDCSRDNSHFITAAFCKALKDKNFRAGAPKRGSLHILRHTFASHLVQAGVDLYSVSKLLGHSSIKMTEIYAHLAPQTLHNAINKLPKLK